MSNYGQAALQITGFVVGSAFGVPQLGYTLGSLAGQALFPTKLPSLIGPRLHDSSVTMARIGQPVDEVFGTDVVAGNVIWLAPVREVATTEEVGGKGGPEQTQTTFTYYQSIALGLARGPMGSLLRIWENGELVYDVSAQGPTEFILDFLIRVRVAIEQYGDTFALYHGGSTQEPDPTIEADKGVGNVPAYRGLMYIVYPDREIKREQGMRHPNFKFEISEYLYVTSRPYPINVEEYMQSSATAVREGPYILQYEFMDSSGGIISGELRSVLQSYDNWEPEFLEASGSIISGELRDVLRTYDDGEPEFLEASGTIISGTIRVALVSYNNYETEFLDSSGSIVSGTLT